jgi:FlaA1/EpsC-like NDP-sugar epimerase
MEPIPDLDNIFEGKTICVTGGLGSIGSMIVKRLIKYGPKKVIVLDNRETEIYYSSFYSDNPRIKHEFVDIRDFSAINKVLKNIDIVFHAAAMKHVSICEDFPFEAVKTNILGTQNIIQSCLDNDVDRLIFISSDKAANPIGVMGATKLLSEKLIGAFAVSHNKGKTKFGIVRFGNVLYSRGSVLEIWNKRLKEGNKIPVTSEEMTRFFMKTSECVDLIFTCAKIADRGELFILKMPSVKMIDLAKSYLKIKGFPEDHINLIGIRKGEKMHEELLIGEDIDTTILENENFFIRFPVYADEEKINRMRVFGFKDSVHQVFSSDDSKFMLRLDSEKISEVLLDEKELLDLLPEDDSIKKEFSEQESEFNKV